MMKYEIVAFSRRVLATVDNNLMKSKINIQENINKCAFQKTN